MFLSIYLQRNIVNFLKSYNPNIYDDILDKRFTRKYIDNVDERERYEIYKAGFKAYSRMMKVVFFSMIFASFFIIDRGGPALVLFLLSIILLTGHISYSIEAMKSERNS